MVLRPGRLFALYLIGYFTGRFWIEGLRIDPANAGGGWRLNQWVSVAVVAATIVYLLIDRHRHRGDSLVTADTALDDTAFQAASRRFVPALAASDAAAAVAARVREALATSARPVRPAR